MTDRIVVVADLLSLNGAGKFQVIRTFGKIPEMVLACAPPRCSLRPGHFETPLAGLTRSLNLVDRSIHLLTANINASQAATPVSQSNGIA